MKDKAKIKNEKLLRRKRRTRSRIKSSSKRPRLSVFKSNRHIYCQLIDDEKMVTLASANDFEVKKGKNKKIDLAKEVGKIIAKKALDLKIKKVALDRGGYKYHGRVKQLAEGAREGGLEF